MPYTYPPAAPSVSGDDITIHHLLQNPPLIARRLRTIAEQRFIADALLTGRFEAVGGSVLYEQNEGIYTDRDPEAVKAGAEYPLSPIGAGTPKTAKVVKWGQDVAVTDEAIKRLKRNPVDRAFTKLVNHMVKNVDGVALSAINSAVTETAAADADWTTTATAKQIFLDVAKAKAKMRDLNEGYEPDMVVVTETVWAHAMAAFIDKGYVAREAVSDNPALTGQFPVIDGIRWLTSPNVPTKTSALLVDSSQLGGMADENLGGPGYTGAMSGVEAKSIRKEETDSYLLRARRVTVPVVLEPKAAFEITAVDA